MDYHASFHSSHEFCPACKELLAHKGNAVSCGKCGFLEYGNPAPCVSLAIVQDKKILLAKRAIEPEKGAWDAIGGFIDAGETAEQAAIREMREETGLETEVETYLGSVNDVYNERPTLAFIYLMKVKNTAKPVAYDDVAELRWFSVDQPPQNIAFRNTLVTIEKTREYLLGKENI